MGLVLSQESVICFRRMAMTMATPLLEQLAVSVST
jgi:hypothetical protein